MKEQWETAKEVAYRYGVTVAAVHNWADRGLIRRRDGQPVLFHAPYRPTAPKPKRKSL